MITCRRCEIGTEKEVQLHHIIPKYMNGTDEDGRIYLCLGCHTLLHILVARIVFESIPKTMHSQNRLAAFIFKWLPANRKIECKEKTKKFTEEFVTRKKENDSN